MLSGKKKRKEERGSKKNDDLSSHQSSYLFLNGSTESIDLYFCCELSHEMSHDVFGVVLGLVKHFIQQNVTMHF